MITSNMEDYLENILILQNAGGVRVTDLALKMGVAKSSAHMALHTLEDKGLIAKEKYGKITLTETGLTEAQRIYERHLLLRDFFADVLKVSPENAEKDACAVEHILSAETIQKIRSFKKQV